jgi:hypothetical protein
MEMLIAIPSYLFENHSEAEPFDYGEIDLSYQYLICLIP